MSVGTERGGTVDVYCPRCFGLLISPGKDVKQSEMNLLDNMVRDPSSFLLQCTYGILL